jgi:hypothetical protein
VTWDTLDLNRLVLYLVSLFVNIQFELHHPGNCRGALLLRIRGDLRNQALIRSAATTNTTHRALNQTLRRKMEWLLPATWCICWMTCRQSAIQYSHCQLQPSDHLICTPDLFQHSHLFCLVSTGSTLEVQAAAGTACVAE